MHDAKTNDVKERPYPRHCSECGCESVMASTTEHVAKLKHEGKVYELTIRSLPIDKCSNCGAIFHTNTSAEAKWDALRDHLGLLHPTEISRLLRKRGLTQRQFASHLQVAEESVSRWINGSSLQSRSLDTFMRVYFAVPQVRAWLQRDDRSRSIDETDLASADSSAAAS